MEWYHYVLGIVAFLLILGIIVLIHEGGHFLLAKKAGILCHEFSIGMGPVLFQKKIGETVYSIRAIPIGGFVSMAGEEVNFDALKDTKKVKLEFDESKRIKSIIADINNPKYDGMKVYTIVSYDIIGTKNEVEGELFMEVESINDEVSNDESLNTTSTDELQVDNQKKVKITEKFEVLRNAMMYFPKKQTAQIAPYNRNFANKTLLQRFLSVFAGPAMNFVLAFLLFVLLGFTRGYAQMDSTELDKVDENAPIHLATEGKISENDIIKSINGVSLSDWASLQNVMGEFATKGEYKNGEEVIPYNGYLDIVYIDTSDNNKEVSVQVVPNTYVYSIQLLFKNPQSTKDDVHQRPIVESFYKNNKKTLTYKAGLLEGDLITGIAVANNKKDDVTKLEYTPVENINDIVKYFRDLESSKLIVLQYKRLTLDEDVIDFNYSTADYTNVEVSYSEPMESYSKPYLDASGITPIKLEVGISPVYKFDFVQLLYQPFVETFGCVVDIFKSLGLLFNPKANVGLDDFSSVIGIYELITSSLADGFNSLIYIFAFLSANIGFVNLLPLPALDGGRLAFLAFEAITRKKPSPKVENIIHTIGLFALMGLMAFIVLNEVLRLIGLK